jgi:protein phosphatase
MERASLRIEHRQDLLQEQRRDAGTQAVTHEHTSTIALPQKTLIVLCGPAGAGKSTFARKFVEQHQTQGCKPTSIVSSDYCRAMICDDETNQQVNRDTFDLFYYIIRKRLFQGRLTIADSTALQANARQALIEIARRYQCHSSLFVFNMSLETCLAYDQHQTRGRKVGEKVISYHLQILQQALLEIPHEGWDEIHILDEQHCDVDVEIIP